MPRNRERRAAITWLMPLGTLVQFMLPRWVMVRVAQVAGTIAYLSNRRGREKFMDNCRHVMGAGTPEPELRAVARRLFIHLVTNYLDLLSVPAIKRRVTNLVEFDSRGVDEMMAEGRGIVVVTGHIGNHDLAGVYMAAKGYPMSAVYEPVPGGWADTFNRYRGATAMETIPVSDRRSMARALLKHRLLALVSDRDITGNGTLCPAFDSYRYYPKGAAAYALRLNIPILVAACLFQYKPGRPPYYMYYRRIRFTPTGDMNADVPAFTAEIAAALNGIIKEHPDQWLVFNGAWQPKP
jgi:Kdo2-lipid IVA lauroyltransferase/acyltransferase